MVQVTQQSLKRDTQSLDGDFPLVMHIVSESVGEKSRLFTCVGVESYEVIRCTHCETGFPISLLCHGDTSLFLLRKLYYKSPF